MDLLREGLFIGAIAYAYQEITKQKILNDANLKYATLGGVLGLMVGPRVEDYIRADKNLDPEMKKKLLGTGVGAALGYALGDKVSDQAKKTFSPLEKRVED